MAIAVQQGFKARWQVIRDLGGDPRQVDALLEADPLDVRPEEKDDAMQQQKGKKPGKVEDPEEEVTEDKDSEDEMTEKAA